MLHLAFAESALELVPKELWSHPSVVKSARKARKHPGKTILDRTYHHRAMLKLKKSGSRGRPDILHISLIEALGTPLNKERLLKIYIHTKDDHLIWISPEARLPRNYSRFVGLIERLYEWGKVPLKGRTLLRLEDGGFQKLLKAIKPSYIVAFSRIGRPKTLQSLFRELNEEDLMVVVGAFPRGHFSKEVVEAADEVVSIDVEALEAWTVTSRVIYEFEKSLGLPEKRLKKPDK